MLNSLLICFVVVVVVIVVVVVYLSLCLTALIFCPQHLLMDIYICLFCFMCQSL